jgi:inward rectifier potassium channel
MPFWRSLSLYHWLLTISWPLFFVVVSGGYFATNLVFATGYLLCGPDALLGLSDVTNPESRFFESFFFSVHTLATIGYGTLSPKSMPAHLLVTLEALVGLLGFALATGLLFARFSKPSARILYSRNAVIAPYRDGTALMVRIANARSNQLIDVKATVALGWMERVDGKPTRRFHELGLERKKVDFFPLHWVVVHPIDAKSPLGGITREQLAASGAEIFVMITGVDETFSQPVFSRTSYRPEDISWGAKFSDIFIDPGAGRVGIDLRRLHDTEPAG